MVELLVTIVLAGLVFGATLTVLEVFQSDARSDQLRNENQDNARNAVDRLARQLRNVVSPSTEKAGALLQAQPYEVAFQTIDSSKAPVGKNVSGAMLVRYCLDDSKVAGHHWYYIGGDKTSFTALDPAAVIAQIASGDCAAMVTTP